MVRKPAPCAKPDERMVRKPAVWFVSLLVLVAATLLGSAVLEPVAPVAAAAAPAEAQSESTPAPAGQAPVHEIDDPSAHPPQTPVSPTATATPGGIASTVQTISTIIYQLEFPFDTMMNGIVKMSGDMAVQAYSAMGDKFQETIQSLVFGEYGIAPSGAQPPLFTDLIYNHWRVMYGLALLLMPVTLALNAAMALRQGAASTLGFADLKEALVGWVVSVGGASASYYLLSLFYRLSVSAALAMTQANFGDGGLTAQGLRNALFSVAAIQMLSTAVPILGLTIGFFILFLVSSIVIGLALALAAFVALMYVLATLAPVLLILGSLKPLEWLKALWLKVVVIVLLLPITDVLLLKAAASISTKMLNGADGNWGIVLGGICLAAGLLSILITINFKVAELVFGAIGEIGRNAWDSTMGVAKMVAAVAGFGVGLGLAGAAGGVGLAGAGAGAAGGVAGGGGGGASAVGAGSALEAGRATSMPGGSGNVAQRTGGGALASGTGSSGPSAPQYPLQAAQQARQARTLEGIGRVLARTGNPLLQGLGRGMEMGGMTSSAQAGAELDNYTAAQHAAAEQRYEQGQARQAAGDEHRSQREAIADQRYTQGQTERAADKDHRLEREQTGDQRQQRMDQDRAAEKAAREQAQAEREAKMRDREVLGWSQRAPNNLPADGFVVGREANTLMEGGLHRAMMDADMATDLADVRAVSDAYYGAWQAQMGDENADDRARIWQVMSDSGLVAGGATTMLGEMNRLASEIRFAPAPTLESAVRRLHANARTIAGSDSVGQSPA